MADPLEIAFSVTGLNAALSGLGQMARTVERVSQGRAQFAGAQGDLAAEAEFLQFASIAGGAATAITVVTTALIAFTGAIKAMTDQLQGVGRLQAQLASTGGETAQMRILGRALGFDPAGLANAVRSAGTGGGLGSAAFANLGATIQPFDVGQRQDLGGLFLQLLRSAGQQTEAGQGTRVAADLKNLGLEAMTNLLPIWRQVSDEIQAAGEAQAQVFTPALTTRATHLNLQIQILEQNFQALLAAIGGPLISSLTDLVGDLNSLTEAMVRLGPSLSDVFQAFLKLSVGDTLGAAQSALKAVQDLRAGQTPATDANTKALNDNTFAVRQLAHGVFGGGRRARSAIPNELFGGAEQLRAEFRSNATRLGAYSVGL